LTTKQLAKIPSDNLIEFEKSRAVDLESSELAAYFQTSAADSRNEISYWNRIKRQHKVKKQYKGINARTVAAGTLMPITGSNSPYKKKAAGLNLKFVVLIPIGNALLVSGACLLVLL
jgi:hypothetical protein